MHLRGLAADLKCSGGSRYHVPEGGVSVSLQGLQFGEALSDRASNLGRRAQRNQVEALAASQSGISGAYSGAHAD